MTFTRSPSIWLDIAWVLASVWSREFAQSMGAYRLQGSSEDALGCWKPRLFCEVLQEGKVKAVLSRPLEVGLCSSPADAFEGHLCRRCKINSTANNDTFFT
jgi:hypothetical protein